MRLKFLAALVSVGALALTASAQYPGYDGYGGNPGFGGGHQQHCAPQAAYGGYGSTYQAGYGSGYQTGYASPYAQGYGSAARSFNFNFSSTSFGGSGAPGYGGFNGFGRNLGGYGAGLGGFGSPFGYGGFPR